MFYQENAPLSLSRGESLRGSAPPRFQDGDHRDVWCSEASRRSHRDAQRTARALLAEPASASLVLLPNMAQSVNITELNLPQLEMLKNQLDQEVEFLSTSIAQLKVVQTKYVEAKDCLNVLNKSNEGKELLVPLTSSMYVPGKLHDVEHVLIDVGTGYYVEKTAEDAKDFFKRKIDFLTKQMEKIQPALQEKHAMKQAVMEMMSQKIQQLTALGATQATAKA
ncbi:prefoldin subunit 5 [Equus caballus]|uniref:prefoldin subunit 5 n=1 Tax=Equus caballus TaxID=9796 RepID=UPI0038B2E209